ncbi:MAG TPA: flagellin [Bryobacteraceae bacterium]|nr:flagellin [Bryobacteraceae bacterium]
MLSIQTNVNSLIAQQNLNINNEFQAKTIQQLTSGYRINSSGDDAAGLAVANKYRSDVAELTQGVANGNDGAAQLQIMDGGMSNISQILDRLKTLATQSASGTFTGSRTTVNAEFQNDLAEIDRQAQSIGLNTGGTFNTNLNVYLGTGSGSQSLSNGIVTLGLSGAAVDTQALGMKGMQAVAGTADLGNSSGTSVAKILADSTNTGSEATSGSTSFVFSGAGFSDANKVTVSVDLSNVSNTDTLVTALNSAIQAAGTGSSPASAAFAAAGLVASVHTNATTGTQQIAFTSTTSAFQVQAGDRMSNALMGNFTGPNSTTGAVLATTVAGGATAASGVAFNPTGTGVTIQIQGAGLASPVELTMLKANDAHMSDVVQDLKNQVGASTALGAAGITVSGNAGGALTFTSARGESFSVMATGDTTNQLGLGAFVTNASAVTSNNGVDYTAITGGTSAYSTATVNANASMEFSINGAASVAVPVDLTGGDATAASTTSVAITNAEALNGTTLSFSVDGVAVAATLTGATAGQVAATGNKLAVSSGTTLSSNITVLAATSGHVTGTATVATHDFSGTHAETFTVAVDGGHAQAITLGVDMSGSSAADYMNVINAQLVGATVTNNSGTLTLTSNSVGGNSSVAIVDGTGTPVASYLKLAGAAVGGANGTNQLLVSTNVTGYSTPATITIGAGVTATYSTTTDFLTAVNAALFAGGLQNAGGTAGVIATDVGNNLVLSTSTLGDTSWVSVAAPPLGAATSAMGNVGLAAGTGVGTNNSATTIANTIQTAINTATGVTTATAGDVHATVTVNSSNQLVITNDNKGAGHTVSVLSGTAETVLGDAGTVVAGTDRTGASLAAALNTAFSSNATLQKAGLVATWASNALTVTSANHTSFRVNSGTTNAATVTGTANISGGVNFSGGGNSRAFQISLDGGATWNTITLNTDLTGTGATGAQNIASAINTALGNLSLGVTAGVSTTDSTHSYLTLTSNTTGAASKIQLLGPGGAGLSSAMTTFGLTTGTARADADLGFGLSGASFTSTLAAAPSDHMIDSGGAASANVTVNGVTSALTWGALQYGNDSQAITFAANDADGNQQAATITLKNYQTSSASTTNRSGSNIDQAIAYINQQLQASNNATLQKIVAVKENNGSGDQINFMSSLAAFNVSVGSTANAGDGVDLGTSENVAVLPVGTGANMSVDTEANAKQAITAIASAVAQLGSAQAAVGKGENQLNYATSLAQSQITNFSAAESQIRDANVAEQAANLSKAQVLQQSTIAAMAQANSAPQAVLSLLKG